MNDDLAPARGIFHAALIMLVVALGTWCVWVRL